MANKEALDKVLAHITENPDQWGQCHWHTCFAGWTTRLLMPGVEVRDDEDGFTAMYDADGKRVASYEVASHAQWLLDLREWQADQLFSANHSLADLARLVAEFTGAEVPA